MKQKNYEVMKPVFLTAGILFITTVNAQRYKIKAGVWVMPLFQSGFGMGTLGVEAYNKKSNKSFQLSFAASGGSIAADAETTKRIWFTLERNIYLHKTDKPARFFASAFIEAGNRKKLPGFSHFPSDSILQNKKSFELNPGIGMGALFRLKKRLGFELIAGPKLIVASHKDTYYNSITKIYSAIKYRDVKPGFRLMGSFTYRF